MSVRGEESATPGWKTPGKPMCRMNSPQPGNNKTAFLNPQHLLPRHWPATFLGKKKSDLLHLNACPQPAQGRQLCTPWGKLAINQS